MKTSYTEEPQVENLAPDRNNFEWKNVLHEALVEVNPDKLKEKVAEAEAAIFQRLQALRESSESAEERHALQDASNALLTLKRELLKFPDWRPR
jgi:hypothetical protein